MSARQVGVFLDTTADYSLPVKEVIREAQAVLLDQPEVETPGDLARRQRDGVCRVMFDGDSVMWIPEGAKRLQARLMVDAHMKEGGHSGMGATVTRLRPYCLWMHIEAAVQKMVRQCLHCANSRSGGVVTGPVAALWHSKVVGQVLHFDYLHLGGAEGDELLAAEARYECLLVQVEDIKL